MSFPPNIIDQLLHENESSTLDFKRDQYVFERASNADKCEILKDILAFTNAWRRIDAYILIGVEEVRTGRSRVVGVTNHLDDAKLQQFVNSKTQRPLHFSYHAVSFEGKNLGIIHIPPQERPLYLMKDFGKLQKEKVYVRRGSSTVIATPDEVSKIGQSSFEAVSGLPILQAAFFDSKNQTSFGTSAVLNTLNLELPEEYEIPDYGVSYYPSGIGASRRIPDMMKNKNYWRESAKYLQTTFRFGRLEFIVSNSGHSVAHDVRLECEVATSDDTLFLADATTMPEEPSSNLLLVHTPHIAEDITVQQAPDRWIVKASLGKIQPRSHAHTESGIFLGAKNDRDVTLRIAIRADNLPVPTSGELYVEIHASRKTIDVNEFMTVFKGNAFNKAMDGDEE